MKNHPHDGNQDVEHEDGHHDLIHRPDSHAGEVEKLKREILISGILLPDVGAAGFFRENYPPPHGAQQVLL